MEATLFLCVNDVADVLPMMMCMESEAFMEFDLVRSGACRNHTGCREHGYMPVRGYKEPVT